MRSFNLLRRFCTKKSVVSIPKALCASDHLLPRHIGPNQAETEEMLKFVEASSINDLMKQTISQKIVDVNSLADRKAEDSHPLTESEFLNHLREIYSKNQLKKTYIGQGFYGTILPAVIQRNLLENPGWYFIDNLGTHHTLHIKLRFHKED